MPGQSIRKVTSPDGDAWTVRRRWMPGLGTETPWARFTRRFRRTRDKVTNTDVSPDGCVDELELLLVVLAVIVVVVVAVFFVIPLLVAVVDLLILLLLVPIGWVGRVIFRRPWLVDAAQTDPPRLLRWRIVGWRRAGEKVEEVARLLEAGSPRRMPRPS